MPTVRIALAGDVMTGRGIDQILRDPCAHIIHEDYLSSALDYVVLAERINGTIPRAAAPAYVWGDALAEMRKADARIVNLETAITRAETFEPKGINYRMSPENADVLAAARIDCAVLANNHVLDWQEAGFADTLDALDRLHVKHAGAGVNIAQANAPAVLDLGLSARVVVWAAGMPSAGVPRTWAATAKRPGVNVIDDLAGGAAKEAAQTLARFRKPGDIVIASLHWGPNWGYGVTRAEQDFAHRLIDEAGVAIVHGHSSHHAKGLEMHAGGAILYGCGDFVNDYEGIAGHEAYRGDLAPLYVVTCDVETGAVADLEIVPFRRNRFRLERASREDAAWLHETLARESAPLGTQLVASEDGRSRVRLSSPA